MSRQDPSQESPPQPYWDGTRWQYPSQGSPPPPHVPPAQAPGTRRAHRRRYRPGVAVVLVMLVALGSVVAVIAVRGHPTTPGSAPTAQEVFELPYARGIRSAEFRVHYPKSMLSASGVIEFAPQHAFSETLSAGGGVDQRWVEVGGVSYWAYSDAPYQAQASEADPFQYLGWDGAPPPDGLEIAGHTRFGGQPAWVLKKADTGDRWIVAERTGAPLEAVLDDVSGKDTYTFSDWGRAPRIQAPAAADVSTERYRGTGSHPVVAPAATVRVLKAQPDSAGDGDPPGFRRVAVEISYKNTTVSSRFDNDPSLVSSDGVFGDAVDPSARPALTADRVLYGKTVTGWDGFLVPKQATSFQLLVGEQAGETGPGSDYLISISVKIPG